MKTEEDTKNQSERRAEDVAYTINHAFACTATDLAGPFIGDWTQKYLGSRVNVGCGHDHTNGHLFTALKPKDAGASNYKRYAPVFKPGPGGHEQSGHLGHWLIGEAIGDFGAVPITVALTRHAPGFMNLLRRGMETVLGPLFHRGAKKAAQSWAKVNAVAPDSQAAKAREEEIYQYEIRHLPQAAVWTVSSIAINVGTQKLTGNTGPLSHLIAGKLTGAGLSAAVVVAGRSFFPATAHRWDNAAAQNLFIPATKAVSGVFGIDSSAVERMRKTQEKIDGDWRSRTENQQKQGPQNSIG